MEEDCTMGTALRSHADYLNRYGFIRWVLRECVRANPLYVVSAALLAYGVQQLNTEMDPQVGKLGGVVVSLALLHLYELAILGAATTVLKLRGSGCDMHGLMLNAAIFLGGSFLALDELIALYPWLGLVLLPAAVALALAKLAWYARLPGIALPFSYRITAVAIVACHALSPLLSPPAVKLAVGERACQELSWLVGWLSLVPLFWLVAKEAKRPTVADDADLLLTPWSGIMLVFASIATGALHLYASDWVFDRASTGMTTVPMLFVLMGIVLLLRWQKCPVMTSFNTLVTLAPAVALQWLWNTRCPYTAGWSAETVLGAAPQAWLAACAFYIGMALATRQTGFYLGLVGPAAAPAWTACWHSRGSIPHFRALASAALGFVLLAAGTLLSLYREKLLAWLDPQPEAKPEGNAAS
jgi:hypothetical protein